MLTFNQQSYELKRVKNDVQFINRCIFELYSDPKLAMRLLSLQDREVLLHQQCQFLVRRP
jgi:hypothetical protein